MDQRCGEVQAQDESRLRRPYCAKLLCVVLLLQADACLNLTYEHGLNALEAHIAFSQCHDKRQVKAFLCGTGEAVRCTSITRRGYLGIICHVMHVGNRSSCMHRIPPQTPVPRNNQISPAAPGSTHPPVQAGPSARPPSHPARLPPVQPGPRVPVVYSINRVLKCDLNCSVRGRVSSWRTRFWTLPNLHSEVSAYLDTSEP